MKRSFSAIQGSGNDPPSLDDVRTCIDKRLFVGRLPPEVTEQHLRDLFCAFGTLTECRLLVGKSSAFVGFSSWGSAHRALVATDNQVFPGCQSQELLHVSFGERAAAGRGAGKAFAKGLEFNRLFVGGLPASAEEPDLREIFEQCGRVEEVQMLPAKGQKRCGFVRYGFWGEALDAVETLDGQRVVLGSSGIPAGPLTVVMAVAPAGGGSKRPRGGSMVAWEGAPQGGQWVQPAPAGGSVQEWETLKAAYLAAIESETPDKVCDELHRKIMAARMAQRAAYAAPIAGPPIQTLVPASVRVLGSGGGGGGPGSGYFGGQPANHDENWVPPEVWSSAGQVFDDKDLARLFVGALPAECTDEEFHALVSQVVFTNLPPDACQILECRVLPGRGCGYLRFSSWEAATEALAVLHDRSVAGWPHPLRVKWAQPKTGGGSGATERAPGFDTGRAVAASQVLQGGMGGRGGGGGFGGGFSGGLISPVGSLGGGLGASSVTFGGEGGGGAEEVALLAQGLDPRRLFVGQISRELIDESHLVQIFEAFGQVEHCRYLSEKGVAYISFATFESAKAAMDMVKHKHFPGVSREGGLNINFSRTR